MIRVPSPSAFPVRCDCGAAYTLAAWLMLAKYEGPASPEYEFRHCTRCGRERGVETVLSRVERPRQLLNGLVLKNPWATMLALGVRTTTPYLKGSLAVGAWVALTVAADGDHTGWALLAVMRKNDPSGGLPTHGEAYKRHPKNCIIGVGRVKAVFKPDPNPDITQYELTDVTELVKPVELVDAQGNVLVNDYKGLDWTLSPETAALVRAQVPTGWKPSTGPAANQAAPEPSVTYDPGVAPVIPLRAGGMR